MKMIKYFYLACLIQITTLAAVDFPYTPKHEIKLISGLQLLEHPVTTTNSEAQKFFNQGLVLVYGFNHDAAYWSFQKAVELDPNLAMGYWGMALALGPNINSGITETNEKMAFSHIQKALELSNDLSKNVTENEKDYIFALSKRYTDSQNPDLKKLGLDYSKAMKEIKNKYPDDPDLAVLYAESAMDVNPWKLWTVTGEPENGTLEIVDVLESVIKRVPNHLGANHYYIHAIEASKHPEYALTSADKLRNLSPNLGHIMHMPGHIYLLVGDYRKAALVNEIAIMTDLNYIRQNGMEGTYPMHYLSHNYYFYIRALSMEGSFKRALKASEDLMAFYFPEFQEMPSLEYYLSAKMSVLLRFHKWKEMLEMEKPNQDLTLPITESLWHFSRAIAYAGLNDKENALKEQQAYNALKASIPANAEFGFNSVTPIFKIASSLLDAKLAKLDGDFESQIEFLKEAVKTQDTLSYNEPPDWYFPVRESLGGAYLRNKQFKEAENIFREDLNIHPRNGRSLFGLLHSLKNQGRTSDIFYVQKEFDQAWKYSDTTLNVNDL